MATLVAIAMSALIAQAKKVRELEPSYAWTITDPLGERYESTIDTLQYNQHLDAVPSAVSKAYVTTGNLGAGGQNEIFFDRPATSNFFFEDVHYYHLPGIHSHKFYNTRIPTTIVTYNTGGSKENTQDRLSAIFSGNVNKRTAIGASMDYIYSKGFYNTQATRDFSWNFFGSHTGDRYELQAFFNNYNFLNKENGGFTDDRYLTDPAEVQGGSTSVDYKSVPINLTDAHSQIWGHEFYLNQRYKVGYYRSVRDSTDSIVGRTYIPVTSFIWTLDYKTNKHMFLNEDADEDTTFFENTYFNLNGTLDRTRFSRFTNTVGIQLLEGFHQYAKFGLAAYLTYEIRKYTQTADSIETESGESGLLTALPDVSVASKYTDNVAWVGGQLTKQHGSILTYNATAQFGILGSVTGDVSISGDVSTKIRFGGDSVVLSGYGYFKNEEVPYLLQNYVSNHYIWQNSFDKVRRYRIGGQLDVPFIGMSINVGVENIENYTYFGYDAVPVQNSGSIQVVSASLDYKLKVRALNWNTSLTYQTSSDEDVLPLPKFSVYSNLFINFAIAKVLKVNMGIDGSYYTEYYAPSYNPATMSFYNQNETKCGNFPYVNAYFDFKLSKTRFYVMMTNLTDGMFGDRNFFSSPHYPLNARRFLLGLSVEFRD